MPDITAFNIQAGEFLLLGCDGLWSCGFDAQEAVNTVLEVIRKSLDEAKAAGQAEVDGCEKRCTNRLLFLALREKKAKDNVTVAMIAVR